MYEPSAETMTQLRNNFSYHRPHGDQAERYEKIRNDVGILAAKLACWCPESRELREAQTRLEEAVMWANAAIARNENRA